MNKKVLLITAFIGLLLLGGAGFGIYMMKMNENSFKGTALPVAKDNDEMTERWVESFKKVLQDESVLKSIVEDTDYATKLDVSPDEAVEHLKEAIKVRYVRRSDQIHIGLTGKRKQNDDLEDIALKIFEKSKDEVAFDDPSFRTYLERLEEAREKASKKG